MADPKTLPKSGLAASMPHPHGGLVDYAKLNAEVKAALGISLMAEHDGDTVHGAISMCRKPAGQPFVKRSGYVLDEHARQNATTYLKGLQDELAASQADAPGIVELQGIVDAGTVFVANETNFHKPFAEEVDTCPMCDMTVPREDAHDCSEIVLYDADEAPNAEHSVTLRKHTLDAAGLAQLGDIISAHKP